MIIDRHAHACGSYLTAESIRVTLDNSGADKVILVPGEHGSNRSYNMPDIAGRFPDRNCVKFTNVVTRIVIRLSGIHKAIAEGNEYVHNLKLQLPERIVQFFWMPLIEGDITGYLDEKFEAYGFSGVKLHQCWRYFPIDSGFFRDVAYWALEHDKPVFIHFYSDKDIKKIIEFKRANRNLKLIVAHLFGLELFISCDVPKENLYFDTSSYQLVSDRRVMKAIGHFGAERILLGSDTPYGRDNLRLNIERINSLPLPESDKKMILGGNICELLKIDR